VRTDYLPAARTTIGAASLPGGAAGTPSREDRDTTGAGARRDPRAGREGSGAHPRRDGSDGRAHRFSRQLPQFVAFARSDPRLFPRRRRAAGALPPHHRARPGPCRAVRHAPEEELASSRCSRGAPARAAAYYEAGTLDRVAALVVNTERLDTRPLWEVETLALHEGVPGHHLQVARAHAMRGLPAFRRHALVPAFGEGWALYAEGLGPELGFLRDPFSQLRLPGRRACCARRGWWSTPASTRWAGRASRPSTT
jgi:hypothetical protein